ncbi:MAG: hypothetical protein KDI01_00580 [Halioglobus sp.]|nr:hypothetical protein [Halioglobus sp.]
MAEYICAFAAAMAFLLYAGAMLGSLFVGLGFLVDAGTDPVSVWRPWGRTRKALIGLAFLFVSALLYAPVLVMKFMAATDG